MSHPPKHFDLQYFWQQFELFLKSRFDDKEGEAAPYKALLAQLKVFPGDPSKLTCPLLQCERLVGWFSLKDWSYVDGPEENVFRLHFGDTACLDADGNARWFTTLNPRYEITIPASDLKPKENLLLPLFSPQQLYCGAERFAETLRQKLERRVTELVNS